MHMTVTKSPFASQTARYQAEYGGVTESRSTAKGARLALETTILAALHRLYTGAQVIRIGEHSALVEPTLYGWQYRVLTPALGCVCCGGDDQRAMIASAWSHLAQNAYLDEGNARVSQETILEVVPPSQVAEIRHWMDLQG